MRPSLMKYIEEHENTYLIHCDMFPFKHKRIIDLAGSEFLAIQYAFGLTLQGFKVILFDVAGFILDKSIYFANLYPCKNIYIAEGGAGFTYHPSSYAHYLFNDLQIVSSVTRNIFAPLDEHELFKILDTNFESLCYIRMMPENFSVTEYDRKQRLKCPVYSYGWMYKYLSQKYDPVYRIDLYKASETSFPVIIEDHVKWLKSDLWFGIQNVYEEISKDQFLNQVETFIKGTLL